MESKQNILIDFLEYEGKKTIYKCIYVKRHKLSLLQSIKQTNKKQWYEVRCQMQHLTDVS